MLFYGTSFASLFLKIAALISVMIELNQRLISDVMALLQIR